MTDPTHPETDKDRPAAPPGPPSINREIFWNGVVNVLRVLNGVLLLAGFSLLAPSEELAIWGLFQSFGQLLLRLDFGLTFTGLRHLAYAWAAAEKEGPSGFASVFGAFRKSIWAVGFAVLGVGILGGGWYFRMLQSGQSLADSVLVPWGIFLAGVFFTFQSNGCQSVLSATGRQVSWCQALATGQAVLLTGILFAGLTGKVLLAFCLTSLLGNLLTFVLARVSFRHIDGRFFTTPTAPSQALRHLWGKSILLGFSQIGSFLELQMATLLMGQYLDLRIVASYSLSLQMVNVVLLFAGMYMTALTPRLNWARVQGRQDELRQLLAEGWGLGIVTFLVGAAAILTVFGPGLAMVAARTQLLPLPVLAGFLVLKLLEFNHANVFAIFLLTRDEVPFLKAAWFSGLSISLGTWIILSRDLGGIGLILVWQGLVQLAYNNWQWPYRSLKELQIGPWDFSRLGWSAVRSKAAKVLSLGKEK